MNGLSSLLKKVVDVFKTHERGEQVEDRCEGQNPVGFLNFL